MVEAQSWQRDVMSTLGSDPLADVVPVHTDSERMSGLSKRNVFVLGLDEAHLRNVRHIPSVEQLRFHELLPSSRVIHQDLIRIDDYLEEARRILQAFPDRVDAIVAHWSQFLLTAELDAYEDEKRVFSKN